MKAHISNNLHLGIDDVVMYQSALDMFMDGTYDGVSAEQKQHNDEIAKSVKQKLANHEIGLDAEEMRILFISLTLMRDFISGADASNSGDAAFAAESRKRMASIDSALTYLRRAFSAHGIEIDAL
ncbi:MAG: hypothetical protein RR998_08495 [Oscillospiraceae bacterium]